MNTNLKPVTYIVHYIGAGAVKQNPSAERNIQEALNGIRTHNILAGWKTPYPQVNFYFTVHYIFYITTRPYRIYLERM